MIRSMDLAELKTPTDERGAGQCRCSLLILGLPFDRERLRTPIQSIRAAL